jgi:hypothetical protein
MVGSSLRRSPAGCDLSEDSNFAAWLSLCRFAFAADFKAGTKIGFVQIVYLQLPSACVLTFDPR